MSPGRRIVSPIVALVVAACAEEPSTAVALGGFDEPLDLQLSVPAVSPDVFVVRTFTEFGAPTIPALALRRELPPEHENPYGPSIAEAEIWNAYTDLMFWPEELEAWGEHDYVGNKGRVEVTANVQGNGDGIGTLAASTEESHFFLNPFPHHIIGNVRIQLGGDCGLSADAHTSHSAWWEMTPGSGPNVFDRAVRPTFAGRIAQPECEATSGDGGGGGGGGGIDNGSGDSGSLDFTCWAWFSYDELTLEILDIHGTWCEGGG